MCSVGLGACRRLVIDGMERNLRAGDKGLGRGSLVLSPKGEMFGNRWGTRREGRPVGSPPQLRRLARGAGRGLLYLRPRAGPTDLKTRWGWGVARRLIQHPETHSHSCLCIPESLRTEWRVTCMGPIHFTLRF